MASASFAEHYIDYITSSGGLVSIALAITLLSYVLVELHGSRTAKQAPAERWPFVPPGKSNLSKSRDVGPTPNLTGATTQTPRVQAIFVYPVKSCQGVELYASHVTATGLAYDRLFSFAQLVSSKPEARKEGEGWTVTTTEVDHQWRFITQREFPRLALLQVEIDIPGRRARTKGHDPGRTINRHGQSANGNATDDGGHIVIRFPFERDSTVFGSRSETITMRLPIAPSRKRARRKGYAVESMTIWTDSPLAINMSSEIEAEDLAKLKYFLGVSNPLGLFRVNDNHLRTITRSLPKDRADETFHVGFADAFPVSLINTASVMTVQNDLPAKSAMKSGLDPRRFRANIYITGAPAYAEDEWLRMNMGKTRLPDGTAGMGEYHAACRTARCVLVNVNQDTGVDDRKEPFATLKRTRQVDRGAKPHPCLGLSMTPLFEQGVLRVGDELEVTRTGEHVYEKMFA